ncbi:phage tail protein [uncultured Acidaminococcus sp.]|uniref:phage tail-collar fiber domain-containing protein n=1 Tax=uncultured Acidaminococcus sp. TaxID=352152 RepID=UPI0026DCE43E|nr:phage tail protein [uncultured Acidaminococcus sp.]
MALYPKMIPTKVGQNAIAEATANSKALIFTNVVFGDGVFDGSIPDLVSLVSQKASAPVGTVTHSGDGQVTITTTLTNTDVDSGFYAREVGVMAKVGEDGDEVLFQYTNGGNYVDYVPDKNSVFDPHPFTITCVTGSAANVTVIVSNKTLVNQLELATHNKAVDAHANLIQVTTTSAKPASMADRGLWVELLED